MTDLLIQYSGGFFVPDETVGYKPIALPFPRCLVAVYIISLEVPFFGMSMNPSRTFASALPAHLWTAFWVYLTAPPLGMLLAAEVYARGKGLKQVYCAKLHHQNQKRCIFRCNYFELRKFND